MSLLERDTVMVSTDENGNAVVDLPYTRANNVEGLGRSINTYYSVGNVVYTESNLSVALKCITEGTTSNTELDISSNNVGDTVTDGSVVWVVIARSNVLDEDGILPIANGGTGGNTFVKSASISGRTITLTKADGTTEELNTPQFILAASYGRTGYIHFGDVANPIILAWARKNGGESYTITKPIPFTTYCAFVTDFVTSSGSIERQTWEYDKTTETTDTFKSTASTNDAFCVFWIGRTAL